MPTRHAQVIRAILNFRDQTAGKSKFKGRALPAPSYWENVEQPKSNRRYIQQF